MKRRNFFQTLAAGAAALVLPGGKDVEVQPNDGAITLHSDGSIDITGDVEVTDGQTDGKINWLGPAGREFYLPNSVTRASAPERIQVVYLDKEGWARPIDKKDRPIFGVVDDCKTNPDGAGYLVTVS
jgi:hypothetical protein